MRPRSFRTFWGQQNPHASSGQQWSSDDYNQIFGPSPIPDSGVWAWQKGTYNPRK